MLTGSLPELTDWGAGIEMLEDPENPNKFCIDVELPFTMVDYNAFGLFQYNYVLETINDGQFAESKPYREEKKLQGSFFHTFRPPNFHHSRFRGSAQISSKVAFQSFTRTALQRLTLGELTPNNFMPIFFDITKSLTVADRDLVEDMFEEELNDNVAIPRMKTLAYLAMIGHFGLTSHEKVYSYPSYGGGGGGAYSSYTAYAPATVTYKSPPKPTAWCAYVVEHLDVPAFFEMNWNLHLGFHTVTAVQGLAEAVERYAEHGSYKWLRVMPLISRFAVYPKVAVKRFSYGKKAFSVAETDEYLHVARLICSGAHELKAVADAEQEKASAQAASLLSASAVDTLSPSAGSSGEASVDNSGDSGDVLKPISNTTDKHIIPLSFDIYLIKIL